MWFSSFFLSRGIAMFPYTGLIKWGSIALVLVALFAYWVHLTHTITVTKQELAVEHDKRIRAETELTTEVDKFKQVNAKNLADIQQLQAKAKILEQSRRRAETARQAVAAEYNKRIAAIMHGPRPSTCDDAIQYLYNGIPDLKWGTK